MLPDLQSDRLEQQELDLEDHELDKDVRQQRLMATLDGLNQRYGRGTLQLGSAMVSKSLTPSQEGAWQMRQERRTRRYTTHWQELMVVGST